MTREEFERVREGDVVDIEIIDADHPFARNLETTTLIGKTVRLYVHSTDVNLMGSDELDCRRDWSSTKWPDPIKRGIYGQSLIGNRLPAHILRVHAEEDESRGAMIGLWDWCIESVTVVSRG